MRQALESHKYTTGFGFWIPAFAGMAGVKPLICDSPGVGQVEGEILTVANVEGKGNALTPLLSQG